MRRLVPFLIGLGAAAVGIAIGWALVGRGLRVWESGAFAAGPEFVLVMLLAVVLGAIATVLSWRWIVGPPIEQFEWSLVFPERGAAEENPDHAPTLKEIFERLATVGYSLEAARLDDAGNTLGPASANDSVAAGQPIAILVQGVDRRHGRVVLRIPPPRGDGSMALGFVDAFGALDGAYEELGRYVIAALGDFYPALTYKRLSSGLTEELAASLWAELPERPERAMREAPRSS